MKQKKIISIDELLNEAGDNPITQKTIHNIKYKQSLAKARSTNAEADLINKLNIRTGYYSLKTRIANNPWIKSRPASKAIKWLFTEVFKDPSTYRYSHRLMYQGGLFIFEYKNPKYKGTVHLPWFDNYPLVISLGPKVTNHGPRNIGFNLHLLPPKMRIVVMCIIFELYKKLYRYQIFYKTENPVQIDYKQIIKALDKFGVKFCVRMYIPNRMNKIVNFPLKTWYKAIFIPSRGYNSIRAQELIKEWKKFCKKKGYIVNPNIDWKTAINEHNT